MINIVAASTYNRPDFIPIQYNSIKKFIKNDFNYIVVNNAKFSSIDSKANSDYCFNQIKNICKTLNITHHEITESSRVLEKCRTGGIVNGKYTHDAYACCYAMQWSFTELLPKLKENTFIIDSDLFFRSEINLEEIVSSSDVTFIPQYRFETGSEPICYMWNMMCGFNFNKNPDLYDLNWSNGVIEGNMCDVGGGTYNYLKRNDINKTYLEEHSIYDIEKIDNKIVVHLSINGNINYKVVLNNNLSLVSVEIPFSKKDKLCEDRSFFYENRVLNYEEYLKDVTINLLKIINIGNFYALPNPLRLGFVKKHNSDKYFAVHYRSGANYLNYATKEYNKCKTDLLKNILKI